MSAATHLAPADEAELVSLIERSRRDGFRIIPFGLEASVSYGSGTAAGVALAVSIVS